MDDSNTNPSADDRWFAGVNFDAANAELGEIFGAIENARRPPGAGGGYPPSAGRPRRRPPYAARLAAALADPAGWPGRYGTSADGRHLTITVLAGPDAWHESRVWARTSAVFVVAPQNEVPEDFDWSLLAGHPPVLVRGGLAPADLGRLAAAILRDGADSVLSPCGRLFVAGSVLNGQ